MTQECFNADHLENLAIGLASGDAQKRADQHLQGCVDCSARYMQAWLTQHVGYQTEGRRLHEDY